MSSVVNSSATHVCRWEVIWAKGFLLCGTYLAKALYDYGSVGDTLVTEWLDLD